MRYKLLGKSGLRVSELALGAMTFGTESGIGVDKEEARRVYGRFREAGGNFIDSANVYNQGTSETFLGEFIGSEHHPQHVVELPVVGMGAHRVAITGGVEDQRRQPEFEN